MSPVSQLPPTLFASRWIKMIFHLLSIGDKHCWLLSQLPSLKVRASRWPLCLPVPPPDKWPTAGNNAATSPCHKDAPCLHMVTGQCYDYIAVLLSRILNAWYYRRWRAPCTVWLRSTNVLDLNRLTFQHLEKVPKNYKIQASLQPCKSQPKMSLEQWT